MLRLLAIVFAVLALAALPARAEIWQPEPGVSFQWILQGYDGTVPKAKVIDLDMFETSAIRVANLKAHNKKVICYISFGSWENWRPDKSNFPAAVIGKKYDGWAGERWLDIRQIATLAPIFEARLDKCKAKGFDAVEPDNLDSYENDTGFAITKADQLAFINWLADAAHARGLSIGLKNVPEFAPQLAAKFDWALTEDCYDQRWCGQMKSFISAGKAVFAVEYTDNLINFKKFCARAAELKFSPLLKRRSLNAWTKRCPA